MDQYMARIVDNSGCKQRFKKVEGYGLLPMQAAMRIVEEAHVRNNGSVLMAEMCFDYPTASFKTCQYRFDWIDGKIENWEPVK